MEVVLVNTAPKYGQDWWVDNIKYMLDGVHFEYDRISVIKDSVYGGPYDKLRLFDRFKDPNEQYIYFDLDICIMGDVTPFVREDFTLLHAWWRPILHTPLNSSIMSWKGDRSDIYNKFMEDDEYWMVKYYKGIDEYIKDHVEHKTYEKELAYSYNYDNFAREEYPVCIFNQAAQLIRDRTSWAKKYTL